MKQVLRYPGSKARIASWIVEQFPSHHAYVEPFAGSAVVLLAKSRSPVEILNDRDGRVCNFFRVMRDKPEELAQMVELTPWARSEYEESLNDEGSDVERARRFLVLCWQGFNGSTADNCGWLKQVKESAHTHEAKRWGTVPNRIKAVASRLQGVQIEARPAIDVIRWACRPEALIYADPPYVTGGSRYEYTMGIEEHEELLDSLLQHPGPVFLSAYDHPLYEDRLRGWTKRVKQNQALNTVTRQEVLWSNVPAAGALL